jgi:hypothetical protein
VGIAEQGAIDGDSRGAGKKKTTLQILGTMDVARNSAMGMKMWTRQSVTRRERVEKEFVGMQKLF